MLHLVCRKKTNTLLLYKQHVLCTVRNKPEKEKPATCRSAPREVGCAGWDQARCFCSGVDVQSRFITVLQQKPFRGHAPMEHPFFSGMWSPGSGEAPIVLEVQRGAAAALLPQPHLCHIPVLQRTAPAALVISLLLLIGHMRMFPL